MHTKKFPLMKPWLAFPVGLDSNSRYHGNPLNEG
jgi:hypothetical protein